MSDLFADVVKEQELEGQVAPPPPAPLEAAPPPPAPATPAPELGSTPAEAPDLFANVTQVQEDERAARVRTLADIMGATGNPDDQAAALEIQKKTGAPINFILAQLPLWKERVAKAENDPEKFYRENPGIADIALDSPMVGKVVTVDKEVSTLMKALRGAQWAAGQGGKGSIEAALGLLGDIEVAKTPVKMIETPTSLLEGRERQIGKWEKVPSTEDWVDPATGDVTPAGTPTWRLVTPGIYQDAAGRSFAAIDLGRLALTYFAQKNMGKNTFDTLAQAQEIKNQSFQPAYRANQFEQSLLDVMDFAGSHLLTWGSMGVTAAVTSPLGPVVQTTAAGVVGYATSFAMEIGNFWDFRDQKDDQGNPVDDEVAMGAAIQYALLAAAVETGVNLGPWAKAFGVTGGAALKADVKLFLSQMMRNPAQRRLLSQVVRDWAKASLAEGGEEGVQNLLGDFYGWYTRGRSAGLRSEAAFTWQKGNVLESFEDAVEVAGKATVGAFLMGAGGTPVRYFAVRNELREDWNRSIVAERQLASISQHIPDSPTAKGAPEAFTRAVVDETERSGEHVTHAFIDVEGITKLAQEHDVDPVAMITEAIGPEAAESFKAAQVSGEKLKVSLQEYVEKWHPSGLAQELLADTTTRANGIPTPRERAKSAKDEADLIKKLTDQIGTEDDDPTPYEELINKISKELVTAGKVRAKDAKPYVALWRHMISTEAERMGIERDDLAKAVVFKLASLAQDVQPVQALVQGEMGFIESPNEARRREARGEVLMTLDARKLAELWAKHNPTEHAGLLARGIEPFGLAWNAERLAKVGTFETMTKAPEVGLTSAGVLNIADGRHRLAEAAKRGGSVVISVPRMQMRQFGEVTGATMFQSVPALRTDSKAFQRWFGKSQVVGEDGMPLVVYHMTPSSFDRFKMGKKNSKGGLLSGPAAWFSPTPELTHAAHNTHYGDFQARKNGEPDKTGEGENRYISGTNVMPVYLRIERPLIIHGSYQENPAEAKARKLAGLPGDSVYITEAEVAKAKELGNDGIIRYDADGNVKEYVIFDAKQVKSVFNRGTWDRRTQHILEQGPAVVDLHRLTQDARVAADWWEDNPILRKDESREDAQAWLDENPTKSTAGYRRAMLNPAVVAALEGARGEHLRLAAPAGRDLEMLEKLAESMRESGYQADSVLKVWVEADGSVKLAEGNHRARAALLAGIREIPVEISYYGGSELRAGVWDPVRAKVRASIQSQAAAVLTGTDRDKVEKVTFPGTVAQAELALESQFSKEGVDWTRVENTDGTHSYFTRSVSGEGQYHHVTPLGTLGMGRAETSSRAASSLGGTAQGDLDTTLSSSLETIRSETGAPVRADGSLNAQELITTLEQTEDWEAWFEDFKGHKAVQAVFSEDALEDLRTGMFYADQLFDKARSLQIMPTEEEFERDDQGNIVLDKEGKPVLTNPLRNNEDFGDSFDLSTICPRQDLFINTIHAIETSMNEVLRSTERHLIGVMLQEAGLIPACWYCYGQAARNAFDETVANWVTIATKYSELMAAKGDKAEPKELEALFAGDGYGYKPNGPTAKFIAANWQKLQAEGMPTQVEMRDYVLGYKIAPTELKREFAKLAGEHAQAATKANQPKSWAKLSDQILNMQGHKVAEYNERAGLRFNSQTDIRGWHLIDLPQAFAQAQARGLMGHVYTKEAAFLHIFGETGMKFNLSAYYKMDGDKVALDERGLPVLDDKRGMAGADIEKFIVQFADSAGGMLVAQNDAAFLAGLVDDRIHQIIPYHKGRVAATINFFEAARDYTDYQAEVWDRRLKYEWKVPVADALKRIRSAVDAKIASHLAAAEAAKKVASAPDAGKAEKEKAKKDGARERSKARALEKLKARLKPAKNEAGLLEALEQGDDYNVPEALAALAKKIDPELAKLITTDKVEYRAPGNQWVPKKTKVEVKVPGHGKVIVSIGESLDASHHKDDQAKYFALVNALGIVPKFGGSGKSAGKMPFTLTDAEGQQVALVKKDDRGVWFQAHPAYMKLVRDVAKPGNQQPLDATKIKWGELHKAIDQWINEGGDKAATSAKPEVVEYILGRIVRGEWPAPEKLAKQEKKAGLVELKKKTKEPNEKAWDAASGVLPDITKRVRAALGPAEVARLEGFAPSDGVPRGPTLLTQDVFDVTATPQFQEWFAGSKMVDENGRPKVWYHGTFATENFSVFSRTEDIGFHFGSKETANRMLVEDGGSGGANEYRDDSGDRILPVYLAIENPLRVNDLHTWAPRSVVDEFVRLGVLTAKEGRQALKASDKGTVLIDNDWAAQVLADAGYDGLIYKNETEGGGDSVVAMNPAQIKSAIGNNGNFDGRSISFLEQDETGGVDPGAFAEWFGDSKALTPSGAPLPLFHGTGKTFTTFEGGWIYLSDNARFADKFATSEIPLDIPPPAPSKITITERDGKKREVNSWPTRAAGLVVVELGTESFSVTQASSGMAAMSFFDTYEEAYLAADLAAAKLGDFFTMFSTAEEFKAIPDATKRSIGAVITKAKASAAKASDPIAAMFSYSGANGRGEGVGVGSQVLPVYARMENPLDLRSLPARKVSVKALVAELNRSGLDVDIGSFPFAGRDLYQILNQEPIQELIRQKAIEAGYDGIIFKDFFDAKVRGDSYVVFDGAQVKSSLGNSGAYDPTKMSILEQPVFTGSGVRGITKLSTDYVGTGQGAASYGWGLYFAQALATAETYRREMAGSGTITIDGVEPTPWRPGDPGEASAELRVARAFAYYGRPGEPMEHAFRRAGNELRGRLTRNPQSKTLPAAIALLAELEKDPTRIKVVQGQTYQVEIPENEELLSWDLPLGSQPEAIQQKVLVALKAAGMDSGPGWLSSTGRDIYIDLAETWFAELEGREIDGREDKVEAYRLASMELMQAGIPGLRYLDQQSRDGFVKLTRSFEVTKQEIINRLLKWSPNVNPRIIESIQAGTTKADLAYDLARVTGQADDVEKDLRAAAVRATARTGIDFMDLIKPASETHNFVIWNDESVKILSNLYQTKGQEDDAAPGAKPTGARGWLQTQVEAGKRLVSIFLTQKADMSTFLHESGHAFWELKADLAQRVDAPAGVKADYETALKWMGVADRSELDRRSAAANALRAKADSERRPLTDAERVAIRDLLSPFEKWARGFESYLMSGKAPSLGLAGAFKQFSIWLKGIYKNEAALRVQLDDEIRGVFDRMLATDKEIEAAARAIGINGPAVEKAKSRAEISALKEVARIHEEWWGKELEAEEEKAAADYDALPARQAWAFLRRGEGTPELKVLGENVKLDWRAVVDVVGLDAAERDFRGLLLKFKSGKDPGISPDHLAALLNVDDGATLLREMLSLPGKSDWVKAQSEQAMKTNHPGILEERARLQALVQEALHDEPSVVEELHKQWVEDSKAAGKPVPSAEAARAVARVLIGKQLVQQVDPAKYTRQERSWFAKRAVLAKAADDLKASLEAARAAVEKAKLAIQEATPKEKETAEQAQARVKELDERLLKAQERLGKAQEKYQEAATKKADASSRRLLAYYMAVEAKRIQRDSERVTELGAKMLSQKGQESLGLASPAARNVVLRVLEGVGFVKGIPAEAQASGMPELLAVFDSQEPVFDMAGLSGKAEVDFDPIQVEELYRTPKAFEDLTVAQMEQLQSFLLNVRTLTRSMTLVQMGNDKVSLQTWAADVANEASRLPRQPMPYEAETQATIWQSKSWTRIREHEATLRDPLTIYLDDEWLGKSARIAIRDRYYECRGVEDALLEGAGAKIQEAFDQMPEAMKARRFDVLDRSMLPKSKIREGPVDRLWMWQILANLGNEGNMARALEGRGWTMEQVREFFQVNGLTREEALFIQGLWDLNDKYLWPALSKVYEAVHGTLPAKIEAFPLALVLSDGNTVSLRGGYWPAMGDPAESKVGKRQDELTTLNDANYDHFRAALLQGFTKGRVQGARYVIRLEDFHNYPAHVSRVIRYIAYEEYVRDANRMLRAIEPTITERLGPGAYLQIDRFLKVVASGSPDSIAAIDRATTGLFGMAVGRVVLTAMMTNIQNAIADVVTPLFAGLGPKSSRVPYIRYMVPTILEGTAGLVVPSMVGVGFHAMRKFARATSVELKARHNHKLHKVRRAYDRAVFGGKKLRPFKKLGSNVEPGRAIDWIHDHGFIMQETAAVWGETIVWTAAYRWAERKVAGKRQASELTALERKEISRRADDVLEKVFPSDRAAEKSHAMRSKGALGAIFTMGGFFNKVGNRVLQTVHPAVVELAEAEGWVEKGKLTGKHLATTGLQVVAIYAVLNVLGQIMEGRGPEPEEEWPDYIKRKMISAPFMTHPVTAQGAGLIEAMVAAPEIKGKIAMSASERSAPAVGSALRILRNTGVILDGERDDDKRISALYDAVALTLGLPGSQTKRVVRAVQAGSTNPKDFVWGPDDGTKAADPISVWQR